MATSNACKVFLYYFQLLKWAKKALVQINLAQPRIPNHSINTVKNTLLPYLGYRLNIYFSLLYQPKLYGLSQPVFFSYIILARNTLSFIEDIKLERQHSALTWLAHARNSGAKLQGAYPRRNGRSLDPFFPKPMCPGMSICINSLG